MPSEPQRPAWRSPNVLLLGLVSLLNDAASEMVVPLLPAFLGTLGAGAFALGWVEGLADFVSSVLKLAVGRWSDRAKRYLPFVVAGYGLAALARPFLALATSAWQVVAVRVTDRTGKGLRTAPRDAILAGSVPPEQRGAAFGLHRALDHTGAVIGPMSAAGLLLWGEADLRTIFLLAVVPGLLSVALVAVGVRERRAPELPVASTRTIPASSEPTEPSSADDESPRPRALLRFLLPLGLFTLGNASDVFLLLKAGGERAPLTTLPLLWIALHVVKASTSTLGGRLSDRWGRRRTIALGWALYVAVYVAFAFAESQPVIWGLFVIYGLHHGLTEGPEKALVSELVPKRAWGGGFGWYHLVVGALTLAASVLFGALWSAFGDAVAFLTSAAIALVATLALAATPSLDGARGPE